MQKFISKYGLAAHLALTAVAPLFLSPIAVIWLSAISALWVILEPSRIGDEMLHESRRRVLRAMLRDPVFWLSLFIVVIALVRYLNTGVMRTYDAESAKWFLSSPEYPLLPGSVEGCGLRELALAVALLPILQGCMHALGKSARQAFLIFTTMAAGLVALSWTVLFWMGNTWALGLFHWTFENPDYAGSAFGVYFACSIVGMFSVLERGWLRSFVPQVIGMAGCAVGLFQFAPQYVQLLFVGVAIILFVYGFVCARLTLGGLAEFKYFVIIILSIGISVIVVMAITEDSELKKRVIPYMTGEFLTEGQLRLRSLLDEVSLRIWKTHPWVGSGIGSFQPALSFHVTPEEWRTVTPLQAAPLNGYWKLLVERGTVGAFLMGAELVLLLVAYFTKLVKGIRLQLSHPQAFSGFLVLIAAALQAVLDSSFLSPGMTLALAAMLALSVNSFPKEKRHG